MLSDFHAMKGLFTIPLLVLLWSMAATAHTQGIDSFSTDTLRFPGEFRSFMEKSLDDEEKLILNDYLNRWSTFDAGEEYRLREVAFLNLLLKKKARPDPHVINYLRTRLAFSSVMTGGENFENWRKGMILLLEDKKMSLRTIDQVILNTGLLLTDNILNRSTAVTWKATSDQYRITADSTLKVTFEKTDLICYSQRDSAVLYETGGTYSITTLRWNGEKGRITWQRAGYDPSMVYALLGRYAIDMSKSEYKADSVLFYHQAYFKEPLKGVLTDKAKIITQPQQATHPQFDSYQDRIMIRNLYENIDFDGGLSMQGARLNGFGNQFNKAKIFIYRNDTLVLKAASAFFVFRPTEVNSRRTEATLYIGKDSIYHPQIFFNFNVPNRELSLLQTEDAMSKSPYYNSLHKVDMSFERLSWKIDEPTIRFTMSPGSAQGTATFQSENYFNASFFEWVQGMDEQNPLVLIQRFSRWYYSEEFPSAEFANYLGMPLDHVQQLLIRLSTMGFVYYNSETDEAVIKPKLHQYLDASSGRIDYDVLNLVSQTEAPAENASLDLKTSDLTIHGVPEIHLSDSQNVTIFPYDNTIILKENRNFMFNGKINAGLFTYYGKQFFFNYDSFMIDMPGIDSLQLRILSETTDAYGQSGVLNVENIIEDGRGKLQIDHPFNKSGMRSMPKYPIFTSTDYSYVYYEPGGERDTTGGEKNYLFKLDPFTVYNLDEFTREDISFTGEFDSRDILPSFAQTLHIKDDMSLGFDHDVPVDGMPIYDGRGFFFNKLFMSNKGLRGSGKLNYLTSTTLADEFLFFPDSMMTTATSFTINRQDEGVSFPDVRSADVSIKWYPEHDQWLAVPVKDPFQIFNGDVSMSGQLNLTSNGLMGDGRAELKSSTMKSNQFVFGAASFRSDTAEFRLRSAGKGFSFVSENVKADIDLASGKGIFTANDGYGKIQYPENQFISYAEHYVWDMNNNDMILAQADQSKPPVTQTVHDRLAMSDRRNVLSKFISVNPKQDSLSFFSPYARYDINNQVILAEQVGQVEVADAIVFPYEGLLTIEKNARIKPLNKARIEILHPAIKHIFYDATVNIAGRYDYFGSGKYDYIDENNEVQVIFFNDISVDSARTIASGLIQPTDSFLLNPYFSFTGTVMLEAGKTLLTFSGGAQIIHQCPGMARNYMAFISEIDPGRVRIPVPVEPRATNNNKIYNGHFITNDSTHIYPAFLSARKNYSDTPLTTASGFLYYDKPSGQYKITTLAKIDDMNLPDNYFSLDRNYCKVYGEGKINMGVDLGQLMLTTAGNVEHDIENNETILNITLGIDFFFSQDALNIMANEIKSIPSLTGVDMNKPEIKKNLTVLAGSENIQKMYDEINIYGSYMQIPPEINKTILLTSVRLRWNHATDSYRSVGKIGIGNIGGTPVNALVDGHLEIQKKRSGDLLDLYLEIDRNTYYFFGYTRGVMMSIAANENFRNTLVNIKLNQRKMDVKSGQTPYTYMIAVDQRMEMFLRRIRRDNPEEIRQ